MTKLTPRDYQEIAVQRVLAELTNAALIGDDPGLGKTLIASEILIRGAFQRVLIMGIRDTFAQWAERLAAQSDGMIELRRINATKSGKAAFADMLAGVPGFYFAGIQFITTQDWTYRDVVDSEGKTVFKIDKETGLPTDKPERERLHAFTYHKMKKHPLDALVFDEVHHAQARNSLTARTLKTIPLGPSTEGGRHLKLGLSGTWFGNSFEGAYAIARWLWPERIDILPTRFDLWSDMWLSRENVKSKDGRKDLTTPSGRPILKVVGESEPGAFAAALPCYIRREAQKPPAPRIVYCDPMPRQKMQLEELKRDLMTWVEDWEGEEAPLVVDVPPVLQMRMRQVTIAEIGFAEDGSVTMPPEAQSAKLGALKGILDHYGDQPVAIYTDSKIGAHFMALRMRRAGASVGAWTGDLSTKDRDALKADFIAGKVQYLIATVQSIGTGIDGLQAACSKVVWISEAVGNPTLNDQAIARFWRSGRTEAYGEFEQSKILMRGSVDVETFEALIQKGWAQRASMRVAA